MYNKQHFRLGLDLNVLARVISLTNLSNLAIPCGTGGANRTVNLPSNAEAAY
jgi:hypothetical protein